MAQLTIDQALAIAVEHHQSGRLAQAEAMYRQILGVVPDHFDALNLLGLLAVQSGQSAAAELLLRRAVVVSPRSYDAYFNLGTAYQAQNKLDDALVSYQRAIELAPDSAVAHSNLGSVYRLQGKLNEAVESFRRAAALASNVAGMHSNLGVALLAMKRFDEAADSFKRAIELDAQNAQYHMDLASALLGNSRWSDALLHLRRALELNPESAEVMNNLANALLIDGALEESEALFNRAIQRQPDNAAIHSNLLLAMHYNPAHSPQAIFDEHRRWNQIHSVLLGRSIRPHANDRAPDRTLRIGYVSPDFRMHSVAFFALPLIEVRNRDRFHVTCYSNYSIDDEVTDRFKVSADAWRNISNLSDDNASEMIRQDAIDILVDLAGHTTMNRLGVFARRAAPVQVTYLGYPDTTGLDAIDYRFTDEKADPPRTTDRWCSEKLIRLPETAWCFTPLSGSPEIEALPAKANGFVTFGSFNNPAKLSGPLLAMWARLLGEAPASRLLIKNDAMRHEKIRTSLIAIFSRHGIGEDRLIIVPPEPSVQKHLEWYNRVDIALDSFPYHGTTTTCEASWMGVPTVTLAGETHVSRVGVSLLSTLGLTNLIAQTPDQYIQIASELAGNLSALSELRAILRERMRTSALMNASQFCRNVERAYRAIWLNWLGAAPWGSALSS